MIGKQKKSVVPQTQTYMFAPQEDKNVNLIGREPVAAVSVSVDAEQVVKNDNENDQATAELVLPLRKKKKRLGGNNNGASDFNSADNHTRLNNEPDYTYTEMLERLYKLRDEARRINVSSRGSGAGGGKDVDSNIKAVKAKLSLPVPQVARLGSKRSIWLNFGTTCRLLHRSPEHVMMFIIAELSSEGSADSNDRLLLAGKYNTSHIGALLRKYVEQYVQCGACSSTETTLIRDSVSRLSFLECSSCASKRSVTQIKAGFRAVTRLDRKRANANDSASFVHVNAS